jgi:hypothetical protein
MPATFSSLRTILIGLICSALLTSCAARRSMRGPQKPKHKRSKRQKCETCPFWKNEPVAAANPGTATFAAQPCKPYK